MAPSQCRFCRAPLRHTFIDLGRAPLANSYRSRAQLAAPEPVYPLHVRVCAQCLLVQLEKAVSPEKMFADYAYCSSYSDSWLEHLRDYVEMACRRFGLDRTRHVIEVGSNDGALLRLFIDRGVPALGLEPARNVARVAIARRVPTRVEFFGRRAARRLAAEGRRADLLIGNNVLAHVPRLNDFVAGIRIVLAPRGVATFEFPHLMRLITETQFDTIYHEHVSYFSFTTVRRIFAAHGLRIFDVEELPTHGGSVRIYAADTSDTGRPIGNAVHELLVREDAAGLTRLDGYLGFDARVQHVRRRTVAFLERVRSEGRSVAGYGAPAKGNRLLHACGVNEHLLAYTVDRNPRKQGRFLPGTRIPVHAPERIVETKPDYVMILPWNLREEIASQMAGVRDWGGRFVVPLPELEVCR